VILNGFWTNAGADQRPTSMSRSLRVRRPVVPTPISICPAEEACPPKRIDPSRTLPRFAPLALRA